MPSALRTRLTALLAALVLAPLSAAPVLAAGSGDHAHAHDHSGQEEMLERMRQSHAGHEHAHDFGTMEEMSEADMHRSMDLMVELGLAVAPMDSLHGREIFLQNGCVVCHKVNGVGGEVGPSLDARDMPQPMNAFEFAARMWRGAPAMARMQEDLFGEMITLTGAELADLVAFAHDEAAQAAVTSDQVPDRFRKFLE